METHCNGLFLADAAPIMERPNSSKAKVLPPERSHIAPVPYMESYSTYLSPSDRDVRPALWTSRSNASMDSKTEPDTSAWSHSFSPPFPASTATKAEGGAQKPWKAPVFQSHPAYIPPAPRTEPNLPSFVDTARANKPSIVPGPKTEPNLPTFVLPPNAGRLTYTTPGTALRTQQAISGKAPVTPADSAYGSITTPSSFDWGNSIHAAPRSITTGSSVNINCYAGPPANIHSCCCERPKHPGRLARWKLAVKEFFHRKTDDDSDIEHIETSHWTEQ